MLARTALERMRDALQAGLGERYFAHIDTIPEDFLQHGGESLVDGRYRDTECQGVGPILRRIAIRQVSEQVLAGTLEGGIEAFQIHLRNQIEMERNQWQTYAEHSVGHDRHSHNVTMLRSYQTLLDEVNAIEPSAATAGDLVRCYQNYLSKDGVQTTHIEGKALATYFGMSFSLNGRREDAGAAEAHPFSIELDFDEGMAGGHYKIFGATAGNGDCLCNAFAQKIADLWVRHGLDKPDGRKIQQAAYRGIMIGSSVGEIGGTDEINELGASIIKALPGPLGIAVLQWIRSLSVQAELLRMAHLLLNPPKDLAELYSDESYAPFIEQASRMVGHPDAEPAATDGEGEGEGEETESSRPDSGLTLAESDAVQSGIVAAARATRPEYFTEGASDEEIAKRFFMEFVNGGAMQEWAELLRAHIKSIAKSALQQEDIDELIDNLIWGTREIAAGRFLHMIQVSMRDRGARMIAIMKKIRPELDGLSSMEEINAFDHAADKKRDYEEFSESLLSTFERRDAFEPSHLRAFYEGLQRRNKMALFYQFVCESSQAQFADSPAHKMAHNIWLLSQLDTINADPIEARSRMPGTSIGGQEALNFGYRFDTSTPYQTWLRNPMVRACGNVVMDALQAVIDLADRMDIPTMIDRLANRVYTSNPEETRRSLYFPDQYDWFIRCLIPFLLQDHFDSDEKEDLTNTLGRLAGSEENLRVIATEAMTHCQNFARELKSLRPTETSADTKPLVLGIGFNGPIFDANPAGVERRHNQIWLTFSDRGRRPGGRVLLAWLKNRLRLGNLSVASGSRETDYALYRPMIMHYVDSWLKYYAPRIGESEWQRRHAAPHYEYCERLMSELEQDLPFASLRPITRRWIANPGNWYGIPRSEDSNRNIEVHIAPPLPENERGVQELTRGLLLDVMCGRDITITYPDLVPLLFLHWQDRIMEAVSHDTSLKKKVRKCRDWSGLNAASKRAVLPIIKRMINNVSPELRAFWAHEIQHHYASFAKAVADQVPGKRKATKSKLGKTRKNIKKKSTQISKLAERLAAETDAKKSAEISATIEEMRGQLAELQAHQDSFQTQLDALGPLPDSPGLLSEALYQGFKKFFFAGRGVAQCVEPSFTTVLGHDRILPVYLSRTPGETVIADPLSEEGRQFMLGHRIPQSIIPPCDGRCQRHAMGHVYAGDMHTETSAAALDAIRRSHGLGHVPDRFVSLPFAWAHHRTSGEEGAGSASHSEPPTGADLSPGDHAPPHPEH